MIVSPHSSRALTDTPADGKKLKTEVVTLNGDKVQTANEDDKLVTWTFTAVGGGKYLIQTGDPAKYIKITSKNGIQLVSDAASATQISVTPGTKGKSFDGQYRFSYVDESNNHAVALEVDGGPSSAFNCYTQTSNKNVVNSAGNAKVQWFYLATPPHTVSYSYTGSAPTGASDPPASNDYAYGENVSIADAPSTPEGYSFDGWKKDGVAAAPFSMPDEDVEITGSFTVNKHNVRYSYTGTVPTGAGEAPAEQEKAYGENVSIAGAPSAPEGYSFDGWKKDGAAAAPFSMPDEDVEITGSFSGNPDSLRYEANGGKGATAASEGRVGDTVAVAENAFQRPGYAFTGWNTSSDGGGSAYAPGADFVLTSGEDVLYARWKAGEGMSLTLSAASASFVYDGKEHKDETVTVTKGALIEGDVLKTTVSGSVKNVADTAEDNNRITSYQILRDGSDVTAEYTVVTEPGKLSVTPATLGVSANSTSKTYGDPDPALTARVTGLVGKDAFTDYTIARTANGEDVGTYGIAVIGGKFSMGDAKNYKIVRTYGNLHITPAELVVKARDAEKTVGEEDPTLQADVIGLRRGDPASVISYTLSRADGEESGSYLITPTGEENQGNYHVSYETAGLTVKEAPPQEEMPQEIEEPPVPQSSPEMQEGGKSWSLINLICAVLSLATGLFIAIPAWKARTEKGENKKKNTLLTAGLIVSAAALAVYFLTQRMSGRMVLTDKWTPLLAVLTASDGALAYFFRKR